MLGLICYNQAYFASKKENYKQAYEYVLMAQNFNQDSRSNQKFEINLYYKWGSKLFHQHSFYDAFEVYADANYRYPHNDHFRENCIISFSNTLKSNWMKKSWNTTHVLMYEIEELDINPLRVFHENDGCRALDARIILE